MLDEPGINHLWRNIFYRCGKLATRTTHLDLFQNGWVEAVDPAMDPFRRNGLLPRRDSLIGRSVGFKPIPMHQIGLYKSPTARPGQSKRSR